MRDKYVAPDGELSDSEDEGDDRRNQQNYNDEYPRTLRRTRMRLNPTPSSKASSPKEDTEMPFATESPTKSTDDRVIADNPEASLTDNGESKPDDPMSL
ncbi:hypothetical protein K493DRAFT_80300 [Basidiobolus meristosporus CBS 931.73]|uniref:Uncharacterized protein n=1 Tax=Basidiobolus meristosporus CBS 931.73 TaxID=1314790 RepID=A0A1Y1XPZ6_9FUNG|nr:hypothetical protein K493DRAFT_80300 [Basidiobolus meristosporus CBS 931.73]|eukprot:ORX87829.1 hypothetical protein K493DRAFT_80300 [Basidiobolus meristosporus CBS 931.73]